MEKSRGRVPHHHTEMRLIFSVQTETRMPSSNAMTLRTLFVAVGILTAVAITPAHAATELVLKVEGIPGDSSVRDHVNEIDVSSVSFGASQTGIREAGGKVRTAVELDDFRHHQDGRQSLPETLPLLCDGTTHSDGCPYFPRCSRWSCS